MWKKNISLGRKIQILAVRGVTALAGILFVVAIAFLFIRKKGKADLYATIAGTEITMLGEEAEAADVELEENQILYDGQVYALNEDLIAILVMGIDKETVHEIGGQSWSAKEGSQYAGGQADALFLVLLNPHDKNIYVIAINRNSMVDIDVYDEEGNYEGVYIAQVALQHGYGDGQEESCQRQVKTVSRMFHNIRINAYAAISMDAIPELNDALGGITVEVLDDVIYPEFGMDLHQGETVTLYGEQAYWYLRYRDISVSGSSDLRLLRQKQYLTLFAAEAKDQALADIGVAVDLYETIQKYMVTDINLSSFTYLATEAAGYEFNAENLYSLEGETMMGENFEEFYVDDTALQELIVRLFYEPVEGQ